MLIKTYKIKQTSLKCAILFACAMLLAALLPLTVSAASKKYSVTCKSSDVKVSKKSLSCSASPAVVRLQGTGGAKKPYPKGDGVTVVTVDCGRSSPTTATAAKGGSVTFKCRDGSAPVFKDAKVIQKAPKKAAAKSPAKGGDSASNNGCANGVCEDPAADPDANCNNDRCDLISKYVNPFIRLFSLVFGIIAAGSIIMGGIQYSASGGDPQKVSEAKKRITNTLIAVTAYLFLFGFLQFLVPGGVFR